MKVIERNIEKTEERFITQYICYQASYNSDGCLTLRGYNIGTKDKDSIVVFSPDETRAILNLVSKVSINFKNIDLPF